MSYSAIDALPYYDKQVEIPAAKAAAQALIEAELRHTQQVADDDPRLPPDVKALDQSRYAEHPIRGIDASKYAPPTAAEGASVDELVAAERQGRIGEGHMSLRNENINVLSTYAPNAYLVRNYQLNSQLTELTSTLTELKDQVTEVNRKRRVFQEDTGVHLSKLEGRWQDLVGSTVQLEMACRAMEGEVKGLRRKEATLREEVAELEAKQ